MAEHQLVTNEEMSVLLEPQGGGASESPGPSQEKRRRVIPYNFRRPDRLSKEQVRSLYLLHDLFAHNLSSSLPIFLRTISEVTLISVEQQSYMEYLYGLPDPTALFTLGMHPLQGLVVVEVNPSVAFPVIDRMLGGPGLALPENRPITEIEQRILEVFLKLVVDDLQEAWKPLIELEMTMAGCETRPQLLQIVAPNEVVMSIVFHVQIGEARGMMSLCIPAVLLEPILEKFNNSYYAAIRDVAPEQTHAILDTLATVTFPIAAEVHGTKTAIDDLLTIAPGDILRLDRRADDPIDVTVGGIVKFKGSLAASNGRTLVQLRAKLDETAQPSAATAPTPKHLTAVRPA